jgi:iron complex transport system permease protein
MEADHRMSKKKIAILIILPVVLFFLSLFIGRYPMSILTPVKLLLSKVFYIKPDWTPMVEAVIFQIRLPRAILAMFVGASLSISGASFQGMFKNPLVSPDILGVSAAAGFGAALIILTGGNAAAIQIFAFVFGIAGVALTYLISRVYKTTPILMLVLSGVVVGSLFSALISVTKYIADPYSRLPQITFWLMGSLASVSMKDVIKVIIPMIVGMTGLMLVSWRLNVLSMGDEEARSLGIRTEVLKGFIIVCCTLLSASAVSVVGMVGWVGLVIPHIGRMLVGPDHKVLLPATLSIGACFLLIVDDIARAATGAEIPLGILTAIIGAPFFAYLIRKTKGGTI